MKKILTVLFCILITFSFSFICFADKSDSKDEEAFPRLTDKADLLTESEENSLLTTLNDLSEYHGVDICVRTCKSTKGKEIEEYADDFYDRHYGENGVILVISMENRDWYISTCGSGITAFTDYGIEYVGDQIVSYLSSGDYSNAFNEFANQADNLYTMYEQGNPLDYNSEESEDDSFNYLTAILISLIVGAVFAFSITGAQKRSLKSVQRKLEATQYTKEGSFMLTDSRDMYLYSTVTKIPKPKDNDMGGSSTHMSSGGFSHGGGGGKF